MRRSRLKKRGKLNINRSFFVYFCIAIFFIGTAYSSFTQTLSLTGTVTVPGSTAVTTQGNMEIYIVDAAEPWQDGNNWKTNIYFVVYNPNDFTATNWTGYINVPGLVSASNGSAYCEADPSTELVKVYNLDESYQARILPGETSDTENPYQITVTYSEKVTKDEIIFDMTTTPPTPHKWVVELAYTNYDTYTLSNFSYTYGDLLFTVEYGAPVMWNGRYQTSAVIKVKNNSSSAVKKFGFKMQYNVSLDETYYDLITSNNTANQLKQLEKTPEYSTYESYSYSGYELAAGEEKSYDIQNITSVEKFKSFNFREVSYTLADGTSSSVNETNTSTNTTTSNTISNTVNNTVNNTVSNTTNNTVSNTTINNTVTNTTVETPVEDEVENPLSFDISYESMNWGFDAVKANITINNSSSKPIVACSFDVVYNQELSAERYSSVNYDYPASATSQSQTGASVTLSLDQWNPISANGSTTFSITNIEAINGSNGVTIQNVSFTYGN